MRTVLAHRLSCASRITLCPLPWPALPCSGVPDVQLSYLVASRAPQQQGQQSTDGSTRTSDSAPGVPTPGGGSPGASGGQAPGAAAAALARRQSSATAQALAPFEVDFDDLKIMRPLGEGSYGKVRRGGRLLRQADGTARLPARCARRASRCPPPTLAR